MKPVTSQRALRRSAPIVGLAFGVVALFAVVLSELLAAPARAPRPSVPGLPPPAAALKPTPPGGFIGTPPECWTDQGASGHLATDPGLSPGGFQLGYSPAPHGG